MTRQPVSPNGTPEVPDIPLVVVVAEVEAFVMMMTETSLVAVGRYTTTTTTTTTPSVEGAGGMRLIGAKTVCTLLL